MAIDFETESITFATNVMTELNGLLSIPGG